MSGGLQTNSSENQLCQDLPGNSQLHSCCVTLTYTAPRMPHPPTDTHSKGPGTYTKTNHWLKAGQALQPPIRPPAAPALHARSTCRASTGARRKGVGFPARGCTPGPPGWSGTGEATAGLGGRRRTHSGPTWARAARPGRGEGRVLSL